MGDHLLDEDIFCTILAGGSGTRFWPKSRQATPKQLCQIGDLPATMLEVTLERLDGLIPTGRRVIVTHTRQQAATEELVNGRVAAVVAEPAAKNTAAALTLAALELEARHTGAGQPIMVSVHADALIRDVPAFHRAVQEACAVARGERLALIGITPRYPETGYGYIEKGESLGAQTPCIRTVASFREKPDAATAAEYLRQGTFLWNSGIFVWNVGVFLGEMEAYLPRTVQVLRNALQGQAPSEVASATLSKAYDELQKVAVDNAVLEVSQRVAVVEADIGWQDLGSWDALATSFPATDDAGNHVFGSDAVLIDTRATTVDSDGPLVACIGVDNLVVVHHRGAVLVCPKDRAQDVKKVVAELEARGRHDLL